MIFHDGFVVRESLLGGENPLSLPFRKGGLGGFERYFLHKKLVLMQSSCSIRVCFEIVQ